uniref:Uncharacterized protein n=1 Tax=Opuntia streptacantha TaxID=393608 RepID=A0A7C8YMX7_OPUST
MGCTATLLISSGHFYHLFDVRLFIWDILPTQLCDALVIDGSPCLPHLLGRLARYRSRVWVGFDITCYRVITLSSKKGRSDGVCSATTYKFKILRSLIRCATFYL